MKRRTRRLLITLPLIGSALLLLAPRGGGGPPTPRGLRAGACARVITPVVGVNHSDPIFMAGFNNDFHATGVHDDLWARGVVLESGGTKIALVTLDVVGYFYNEVQSIRALVDPERGFDSITVTSTHNHEGPDTMGLWGPDEFTSGADLGYLDFVNDQVAACIHDADDALVPAEIKFATGSSEGTSLEPWPDLVADGEVLQERVVDLSLVPIFGRDEVVHVEGDPGPIINPAVPAMQIRRRVSGRARAQQVLAWLFDGAPRPGPASARPTIATLVNFASHPESLGASNRLISSDFPHYVREALEERYGGVAIHMSADLGVLQGPLDVDVADESGAVVPRRSFAFAERMGELLAERAAAALDGVRRWHAAPEIRIATRAGVLVPVENPFFVAAGQLGVFGRRPVIPAPESGFVAETELQVLRIGEATLAVTPNELDPQIGMLYRAQMSTPHRMVAGLGNDEIGYQMPAEKFNPSCFACFTYVLVGNEDACPLAETLDCGTVFINNIGPGADPQLQTLFGELLAEVAD